MLQWERLIRPLSLRSGEVEVKYRFVGDELKVHGFDGRMKRLPAGRQGHGYLIFGSERWKDRYIFIGIGLWP
jgi:hypothetical protein